MEEPWWVKAGRELRVSAPAPQPGREPRPRGREGGGGGGGGSVYSRRGPRLHNRADQAAATTPAAGDPRAPAPEARGTTTNAAGTSDNYSQIHVLPIL